MINIVKEESSIPSDVQKILDDNNINVQNLEDIVLDYMTIRNTDEFFNTSVAYDTGSYDAGDKRSIGIVKEKVREFVDNILLPEINNYNSEEDFDEWIDDLLTNNETIHDELVNIDSYFQEYGDKQMDIWRDDRRDLDRYYDYERNL